jgi:hypothetical protein
MADCSGLPAVQRIGVRKEMKGNPTRFTLQVRMGVHRRALPMLKKTVIVRVLLVKAS